MLSESQQKLYLARMTQQIIKRSSEAKALAQRLWEFFEFQLVCRLPPPKDKEPNKWLIRPENYERFKQTRKAGDLAPQVVISEPPDSPRREEALVHELLHGDLITLGYPRFCFKLNDPQWNLAKGIQNIADHHVMLPKFKSFGYSEDRFLAPPSRPKRPDEKQVHEYLEQFKTHLFSPKGYERVISNYLQRNSIKHETVWIKEMIRS